MKRYLFPTCTLIEPLELSKIAKDIAALSVEDLLLNGEILTMLFMNWMMYN